MFTFADGTVLDSRFSGHGDDNSPSNQKAADDSRNAFSVAFGRLEVGESLTYNCQGMAYNTGGFPFVDYHPARCEHKHVACLPREDDCILENGGRSYRWQAKWENTRYYTDRLGRGTNEWAIKATVTRLS